MIHKKPRHSRGRLCHTGLVSPLVTPKAQSSSNYIYFVFNEIAHASSSPIRAWLRQSFVKILNQTDLFTENYARK
jgi:hypothetical protein